MAVSLIVTDGGVLGLLAVAAAAERSGPDQLCFYWHPAAHPDRADSERAACLAQSGFYGVPEAPEQNPVQVGLGRDPFEIDCRTLLEATLLVRHLGGGEVIWPVNAPEAPGGGPDVSSISGTVNQALLMSELVSMTAPRTRELVPVRVRTPYADLTDRRIADLILDMDLPIWTCWFWNDTENSERARWTALLREAGWTGPLGPQVVTIPHEVKSPATRAKGDSR